MPKKRALITGINGQDGGHLAKFLIEKEYLVYGLVRRQSNPDYSNLQRMGLLTEPTLEIVEGDLLDDGSINRILRTVKPDEVYNLAAQSHVRVSFDEPIHTTSVNLLGTLRLLEAIRCGPPGLTRFYQAGTSEMYGSSPPPQHEKTRFAPRSPYAVAKLAAFWSVCNYREAYNLHASTGILFNHESEYRGPTFVTRKITKYVADVKINGHSGPLELGNLESKRDWGYAGDYVRGMWLMLQQDEPDDYVLGTGVTHTVREFVEAAFDAAFPGRVMCWQGADVDEVGCIGLPHRTPVGLQLTPSKELMAVKINPKFYRPLEVHVLQAKPDKARVVLGWKPEVGFEELVRIMVEADVALLERQDQTHNVQSK